MLQNRRFYLRKTLIKAISINFNISFMYQRTERLPVINLNLTHMQTHVCICFYSNTVNIRTNFDHHNHEENITRGSPGRQRRVRFHVVVDQDEVSSVDGVHIITQSIRKMLKKIVLEI